MNVRSLVAAAAVAGLTVAFPAVVPAQSAAPATPAPAAPTDAPQPSPQPSAPATLGGPEALSNVTIQHCFINKPRPFSQRAGGTQIAFTNIGPIVLHAITFEVVYQNATDTYTRSVQDRGIFAPNTPVEHHYDLYSDVLYAGSAVKSCSVRATS